VGYKKHVRKNEFSRNENAGIDESKYAKERIRIRNERVNKDEIDESKYVKERIRNEHVNKKLEVATIEEKNK